MRQKPFRSIWIIFLFIFVFILAACGSEIPTVEQPLPEQSEATSLPTDVLPTTEPTREPEATPTTETSEKTPEISQPIARWNAVTEAGNWILIGYGDVLNPTVVEPGTYVTINFSTIDDQVTGSGGCNDFTSSYIADDDGNLTVNGPVGTTLIACEIGMEQEGIFIGALESVTAYTVTERGNLLLDYDSGTVYDEQLVFIPERPLVDTVWVLNAYGDPNDLTLSAPGVMTTAMFSGIGTLNGYTGCNNYIASYSVNENQILVDIPMTNLAACGIGMKQEQAFMQLLSAAQSYRLGYNTLEISTVDGSVLRFSAQQLSLENVRWSLTAVDGQEVPDHVTINALFTPADSPAAQKAENSVEGTAGCNAFFGAYTVTGDELTISSIGSTRMFCDDLVMQLEQAFLTGMEGAQSYQFVGGQLLIDTGAGLLTFEADRIPLEGPNWILTGSGPLADPQPPIPGAIFTANFSRQFGMPTGVKTGGTGCNDYTVAYFAASDPIKLNLPQTTQITCSDAQTESEQGYFLSLNAARDYRILGNELYIYFDTQVLIFVGDYQVDEVGPLVPLDGTQWRLTTIDNSAPLPGTEITLAFAINPDGETGKINGSSGCNTYQAAITEFFKLGAVTYANEICDTPEGIMDQENSYLDVLQNANGISMDGAGLTITSSVGILYFTSAGLAPVLPTPTPEALTAVIVAPGNEYLGKTITLDGSLSTPTGGITAYSWWFTGDEFAEGVTVQRTYDKPGAYDAILTVTDAHGGKADASIKVKIHHYLTGPVWVSDGGDITINFGDGTLSGFGGCNDYNASYSASTLVGATNEITVSSISATNKTCSDEIMNREQAFLNNLAAITTYKIDINRISLSNKDGQVIFTGYAASQ